MSPRTHSSGRNSLSPVDVSPTMGEGDHPGNSLSSMPRRGRFSVVIHHRSTPESPDGAKHGDSDSDGSNIYDNDGGSGISEDGRLSSKSRALSSGLGPSPDMSGKIDDSNSDFMLQAGGAESSAALAGHRSGIRNVGGINRDNVDCTLPSTSSPSDTSSNITAAASLSASAHAITASHSQLDSRQGSQVRTPGMDSDASVDTMTPRDMAAGKAMQTPMNSGRFLSAGETPYVVISSDGGLGSASGAEVPLSASSAGTSVGGTPRPAARNYNNLTSPSTLNLTQLENTTSRFIDATPRQDQMSALQANSAAAPIGIHDNHQGHGLGSCGTSINQDSATSRGRFILAEEDDGIEEVEISEARTQETSG